MSATVMVTPPARPRRLSSFRDTALDTLLVAAAAPDAPAAPQALALPHGGGLVLTLADVLSPAECTAVIGIAEALGFVPAKLNVGGGREVDAPNVRRSQRVIIDSPAFVSALWERIRHAVPTVLEGRPVVGLNERCRILKYATIGDFFAPHADGHYCRPDGSASSLLTLLLYLNDGYDGARTTFYVNARDASRGVGGTEVPAVTGLAALQDQRIWHDVPPLTAGVKYALRTEVMYAAAPDDDSVQ